MFGHGWLPPFVAGHSLFSVFPSGGLPRSQHCHSDCWCVLQVLLLFIFYSLLNTANVKSATLAAWLCGWSLTVLHFSIRKSTTEPPLSFWLLICPATIIHSLQSPECSQLAMLNWPWLVAWLCGWALTVLCFSIWGTTTEPALPFWLLVVLLLSFFIIAFQCHCLPGLLLHWRVDMSSCNVCKDLSSDVQVKARLPWHWWACTCYDLWKMVHHPSLSRCGRNHGCWIHSPAHQSTGHETPIKWLNLLSCESTKWLKKEEV